MDPQTLETQQAPPQAPAPTTPPAQTPPAMSWSKTAADATSSPASPAAPAMPAPANNANATPIEAPPPTAAPVRAAGLRGFIDKMVDSLAGTDTSRVRKDPEGNLYIQHDTPTRGQQWLRIASTAFRGAAAGLAAGKGAGNQFKALEAGVQAGDQQQEEQGKQYQQQQLSVANSIALKHQTAANAFAMTRLQVKAAQEDVDFSQKRADWLKNQGGTAIGHVTDLGGLAKLMRETPGFHEDQVKNDLMVPVQQYDADGKANGFEIYRMPQGYGEEVTPPGSVFHVFNPVNGKLEEQKTTEWTPKSKLNQYEMAAGTAAQEYNLKQADIASKNADVPLKGAQAKEAGARAGEATAEAGTKPSESNKNNAAAELDRARAAQVKTGQLNADGTRNPQFELLAEAVKNGDLLPRDLKRQAKGMGLDPNQIMARAFEMGQAEGKPLSEPVLEQMDKFASSPKTQAALDGIDRVIGAPGVPGYMDQMLDLAHKANLAAGPLAGAQNNVSLSVRRFFGDTAAKNLETGIAETRRSIAGLIGNPLLGGSETDKRLEQAQEMLGKSPTLENLQGAANILRTALHSQRQSIVGNNIYLTKRYGSDVPQQQQQTSPAPPHAAVAPGAPQFSAYSSDGKWGWNGSAWVGTGK
jgi:hypothetical protein